MQTILGLQLRRFRRDKRGVSNIIVIVLSFIVLTIIVSNVVLWSYQMNQLDWDKMREDIKITNVAKIGSANFTFKNEGSLTSHLVSFWIINSTNHRRYDADIFINSADTFSYVRADVSLPPGQYIVKFVTERGNVAVYFGT